MSYPEPRYLEESGDISAVFTPSPALTAVSSPSSTLHYLATQESTGGDFGLYRVDMGPKALGANTHFHRTISESFYILSGEASLYDGDRWITARQGDFLYVPAGGLHAFRNDSDDMLSMLLQFSPGAPREEYFEQVAEYARRGPEELDAFQRRHDSFFVDPKDGADL
ncbi:cupin domain-containing protein [Streptomyces sp. NPDC086010]|uniref:cupin domain-containing protein n=1 Tax=Streptomyces sp. NPDC086010 TaxID=3365745 RepID=UPI0037D5042F